MVSCVPGTEARRRRSSVAASLVLLSHRAGGSVRWPRDCANGRCAAGARRHRHQPRSCARSCSGCGRSSSRFVTPTARASPRSSRGSGSRPAPLRPRRPFRAGARRPRAAAARRACAGSGQARAQDRSRPRSRFQPVPPAPAGRPVRCRSTATRAPCRRSSTPTSRSSATSSARPGKNTVDPRAGAAARRGRAEFQAVVDPYARADFFLAASPEGLEVEEGFLTFPTLPGGLLAKVGKLKAAVRQGQHAARHVAAVGRPSRW